MDEKPTTPPPNPSGEANPKSAGLGEETTAPEQPPPKTELYNPSKTSKLSLWWKAWWLRPWSVWWIRAKTAWLLFGELVMVLWAVALWDSYRPKITIAPGGTLFPQSPFGTYFILQNQGDLSIFNVTYRSQLTIVGMTNQTELASTEQNVSVIPQMKSLECYTLGIHYSAVQIREHTAPLTTNGTPVLKQGWATNEVQLSVLLLKFDVSYEPRFFGKRTDTLYFFGTPDVNGNWQWLPSAHESVLDQTIDTNLLTPQVQNPVPVPSPTNDGSQVHVNQVKP